MSDVRSGVGGALVETDPGDEAVYIGAELQAQFDCGRITLVDNRRRGTVPDTAWTSAGRDGDRNAAVGSFDISTVVNRAAPNIYRSAGGTRGPVISPAARPVAGCQVVPPSVETSTPPTTPPVSVAVPVMVVKLPDCTVPPVGEVMVEFGGTVSVDCEAAAKPACKDPG